jgi:tetratricopeptide (TPR) repeat protein
MINLLIALAIGAAFAALGATYASWAGASILGFVAAVIAYISLSRRTANRISDHMKDVERHLRAGRIDRAIAQLEGLRRYARWQFLLGRSIDTQVGALLYAHKQDFTRARPLLERAPARAWHARAMLAADHFRGKRHDEMNQVFEEALKKNKKTSLLYSAYAWCEWKRGQRDHAIEILGQGQEKLPSDEKLSKNLLALKNHKKMKMRGYGPEWFALLLEQPPKQQQRPPGGKRRFR